MPTRRAHLIALAGLACGLGGPAGGVAQDRAERAAGYVRAFHDLGRFQGAALIVDGGTLLHEGALGVADREDGTPHGLDTRFPLGALADAFAVTLALRLAEEGRLPLDRLEGGTAAGGGAASPDGSGAATDLAAVAARAAGRPYDEALRAHVLALLGLDHTGPRGEAAPVQQARGYARTLTGFVPVPSPDARGGAGSISSTVRDLAVWLESLLGWRGEAPFFGDPETAIAWLAAPSGVAGAVAARPGVAQPGAEPAGSAPREAPGADPSQGAARGHTTLRRRSVGREDGVRVLDLTSAMPGYAAFVRAFPDHRRLIVLLDNAGSSLEPLAEGLTRLLWGAHAPPPKPSIAERLLPIVESAGVEPALARYRDWRRTRPDDYEYGAAELSRLAQHFSADRPDVAIALLEAGSEESPERADVRAALAEAYAAGGDTARAVAQAETALSYAPGAPDLLARLTAWGAEPDPILRLPVVALAPAELEGLEGSYRIDPTTTLSIERREDRLWARRGDEPAFALLPQSASVFLFEGSKVQLVFERGPDGATAVSVLESGQRLTFPRVR